LREEKEVLKGLREFFAPDATTSVTKKKKRSIAK
jgi:hypothetical protein